MKPHLSSNVALFGPKCDTRFCWDITSLLLTFSFGNYKCLIFVKLGFQWGSSKIQMTVYHSDLRYDKFRKKFNLGFCALDSLFRAFDATPSIYYHRPFICGCRHQWDGIWVPIAVDPLSFPKCDTFLFACWNITWDMTTNSVFHSSNLETKL